jgi:phosphotriesterase-related protein
MSGAAVSEPATSTPPIDLTGLAQTVLGPVPVSQLRVTMPHEHLFVDVSCMFDPPQEASERVRAYQPFTIENAGWIRYNYFRHFDNLLLGDEETTIAEVEAFKRAGGHTIVDVSTPGIGRDPLALARVARATGINVVMSTGFYVQATHPALVAEASEEALARRMVDEIWSGVVLERATSTEQDWQAEVQSTGVRAGIIKIGCTYPLTENERKVLHAAAAAQRATGAAITIHVGRHDLSALEIAGVAAAAGADMERVVFGHLDVRIERIETLEEVARTGCYLEFDLFGHEISYFPVAKRDMPNDAQRLDLLGRVREWGLVERILVSQDICTKHRLIRYGGHGYGYIVGCVVPRMRERGFSDDEIETILVRNPARLLAFAAPA